LTFLYKDRSHGGAKARTETKRYTKKAKR
jgi:hypothetical protein